MKTYIILPILTIFISLLSSCAKNSDRSIQGYVETRLLYIASPVDGTLNKLYIHRGEQIKAHQTLFSLEQQPQLANLQQAKANLASQRATLANLQHGQRETVLAAIRAQIAQAKARVTLSQSQLRRSEKLYRKAAIDKNSYQEAQTNYKEAMQTLLEYQANLAENTQGSRKQLIRAQMATVRSAIAKVHQAEWYLKQKAVRATQNAQVFDVYFRPGEFVPQATAVLSLFTPQNLHVIFYLPEPKLSQIKLGELVNVTCDGCQLAYTARIN